MFLVRSGIPSLDSMFHPGNPSAQGADRETGPSGIFLSDSGMSTSICIAGPDGTGKSVLAMHYAARYLADGRQLCRIMSLPAPIAFYISSDLSYERARGMWMNFRLNLPNARKVPFQYPQLDMDNLPPWLGDPQRMYDPTEELLPTLYVPAEPEELASYLRQPQTKQVAFIDLASYTAGDDWGFIERLLATVRTPEPGAPRHLLVVDAMEGMETFAGDLDGFGKKTTRRGRVAKLMRLAARKCHLILVIEEPEDGARLPEQFVADVVLRLRATEAQGYSRRTIEIEKARGQSHVRGRHPYVIRDGRGSTTGEQVNADDPRIKNEGGNTYQSYFDVFPSLHSISRAIMQNRGTGRDKRSGKRAGFGIEALDEMLATARERVKKVPHGQDEQGLPCGAVSALIGDANTQKSFLGLAFLGHAFHELAWDVVSKPHPEIAEKKDDPGWEESQCGRRKDPARAHYVRHLCSVEARKAGIERLEAEGLRPELRRWASIIEKAGRGVTGAVVLITTKDENNRTLVERFHNQLREETTQRASTKSREVSQRVAATWEDEDFKRALTAFLEARTICRRLGIHDIPPPVLFHSVRRSVEAAQQIISHDYCDVCRCPPLARGAAERASNGWRIRFVLDDFNSMMRTYGRVHEDPLFLPFLMRGLRREGLSSLIIDTQSVKHGSSPVGQGEDNQSDLRAMSDYRIYTWHVPDFFGDHRIAIAAIPPMVQQQDRKSRVLVRELEWYEPNSKTTPRVNARFELYAGLDTDKPRLVPLQVHLYAETTAWAAYIARLDKLWQRIFDPAEPEDRKDLRLVVVAEPAEDYELMRDVFALHADTNLDYSLIVQVDDFWEHRDAFRSQYDYLTRPIGLPRSGGSSSDTKRITRTGWFDGHGYGLPHGPDFGEDTESNVKSRDDEAAQHNRLDRIPFVWDFGFLACNEKLWETATARSTSDVAKKARDTWERMKANKAYSWLDLLETAAYLATWESARQSRSVPALDLSMVAPEAFSCLVLEIWFSEILAKGGDRAHALVDLMNSRRWGKVPDGFDLATLADEFWLELYLTWLLLAESLDLNAFEPRAEGFGFGFGREADRGAIVTRQWYKSAILMREEESERGSLRFCRLPGSFSVRGDWFLAAVRGSRSDRLADRALDLLSSADGNVDRLLRGLGLPARQLDVPAEQLSTRLHGWHHDREREEAGTLTYQQVLSLGASDFPRRDFHWLWRANLKQYHVAAPIWERWLYRVLRRWKHTRENFASEWRSGFELYRRIKNKENISELAVSYDDFRKRVDVLRSELKQVEE